MNASKPLRVRSSPRSDDVRVLQWLKMRKAGWTLKQLERHFGVQYTTIQRATDAVRLADLDECAFWNELPESVATKYWPHNPRR